MLLSLVSFLVIATTPPSVVYDASSSSTVLSATNERLFPWWEVQAIDTMKYSRDEARQTLGGISSYTARINSQMERIASLGTTHVSIATPYDAEFLPVLRAWVKSARDHNLNVWFRGNWAGWEGWFGYQRITREQHKEKTRVFLTENADLFEDGDIFSACPECENGGPGDPRMKNDAVGFRRFLLDEYSMTKQAFERMNKQVRSNLSSMNGDVARLIMDTETTKALDGVVTMDHYVLSPEKLINDVNTMAEASQGLVMMGEIGAPIPDIHGDMTQEEQAKWMDSALSKLATHSAVLGVNYWVSFGGSTKLWEDDGTPREVTSVIRHYFQPHVLTGRVLSVSGTPIAGVSVRTPHRTSISNSDGMFFLVYRSDQERAMLQKEGFETQEIPLTLDHEHVTVTLQKTPPTECQFFWIITPLCNAVSTRLLP